MFQRCQTSIVQYGVILSIIDRFEVFNLYENISKKYIMK